VKGTGAVVHLNSFECVLSSQNQCKTLPHCNRWPNPCVWVKCFELLLCCNHFM